MQQRQLTAIHPSLSLRRGWYP